MNLILVGLPGTGKGIQAEKIIDTYGVPHISTGDMFRAVIKNETILGLEAKSYIDKGELVLDEVTNGIVKGRFAGPDTDKRFLLDGFPRTLDQAKALDTVLKKLSRKIGTATSIHVEKNVLIERLAGRLIYRTCGTTYHKLFNPPKVEGTCDRCGGHEFCQREDNRPEVIKDHLTANIESSASVLAFYKEQGLVHTINGSREIDIVFSDVKKIIDEN